MLVHALRNRVLKRMTALLVLAVVALTVNSSLRRAKAQTLDTYPPFTLVMQITNYDTKGEALSSRTSTNYHSASGDWRSVGNTGGYEMATIYRRGRGVYISNARTGVMLNVSVHAPGCAIRTAEQLQADPQFTRTETVLGFKAFVMSERLPVGYLMETFFVPELGGGTPVKRIYNFDDGRKIVEEPIKITLGEPAQADVSGPTYRLIERPVANKELASKLISKPDPIYPAQASARLISGVIPVSVIVDEAGRVLSASSNTAIPFLNEAAVEAAYQAWFAPTISEGRPVVASGIIRYQFVLPQVSKGR